MALPIPVSGSAELSTDRVDVGDGDGLGHVQRVKIVDGRTGRTGGLAVGEAGGVVLDSAFFTNGAMIVDAAAAAYAAGDVIGSPTAIAANDATDLLLPRGLYWIGRVFVADVSGAALPPVHVVVFTGDEPALADGDSFTPQPFSAEVARAMVITAAELEADSVEVLLGSSARACLGARQFAVDGTTPVPQKIWAVLVAADAIAAPSGGPFVVGLGGWAQGTVSLDTTAG